MNILQEIVKCFFVRFDMQDEENFTMYKMTTSSTSLQVPNAEDLIEMIKRVPYDYVVIDFRMDEGELITINSKANVQDVQAFLVEINDQLKIRENNSVFYIQIKIIKNPQDQEYYNVYSFEAFKLFLQGLHLKDLLGSFKDVLEGKQVVIFRLLNSSEEFNSATIFFCPGAEGVKMPCVLTRDRIVEKGNEVRYFWKTTEYPFVPEDFYLLKRSTDEFFNNLFDRLTLVFSLIYVVDISDVEENNAITIHCKGYRTINNNIYFEHLDVSKLDLWFSIYQWVYTEGNLVDKVGLARNIISLYASRNNLLEIEETVYEAIKSNYKIYLKQNLQQYVEIKNHISQVYFDLSQRSNLVVDNLVELFNKNVQWLLTFYLSVLIFNTLSTGKIENIFTRDIAVLSYAFLVISFIVLIVYIVQIKSQKERFIQQYDQIQSYYKDLLDENDLTNIFGNDAIEKNMAYINEKTLQYSLAWFVVVCALGIATRTLSNI